MINKYQLTTGVAAGQIKIKYIGENIMLLGELLYITKSTTDTYDINYQSTTSIFIIKRMIRPIGRYIWSVAQFVPIISNKFQYIKIKKQVSLNICTTKSAGKP